MALQFGHARVQGYTAVRSAIMARCTEAFGKEYKGDTNGGTGGRIFAIEGTDPMMLELRIGGWRVSNIPALEPHVWTDDQIFFLRWTAFAFVNIVDYLDGNLGVEISEGDSQFIDYCKDHMRSLAKSANKQF